MIAEEVKRLRKGEVSRTVAKRLKEFESFSKKQADEWFSELCFCILTANSKAKTALKIQEDLGPKGFCSAPLPEVRECIIRNRHRFHNNKAKYIVEARKNLDIKRKISSMGDFEARKWIAENIKGIGYKEASHFLRNTGRKSLAILDRHILNLMCEEGIIKEKPKTIVKNMYFEIEKKFQMLSQKLNMSPAELDLYMWHMKTGEVLK